MRYRLKCALFEAVFAMQLNARQRQYLKGLAHARHPVVIIGDKGLSPAVVQEVERALAAHELIKVKAASADKAQREAWLESLCDTLGAAPVQHIGRILVLYRAAQKPGIALP